MLLRETFDSTQFTLKDIVFDYELPYALAGITLDNIGIVWYCVDCVAAN